MGVRTQQDTGREVEVQRPITGGQGLGESEAPSGGRKCTKLELVQRLEAGGPVLILGFP